MTDSATVKRKQPDRYDIARRSLIGFTKLTYPQYEADPMHYLIGSALDRVISGKIKKLMIFAPPQHGKSELASVRLPAYYLGRFPDRPIILTSYSASLAEAKSREIRGIIETNEEYQRLFPNVKTRRDSRAVNKWLIHGRRGSLLAAGAGGSITGSPAVLGIIDDPFQGWKEAQSPVERENVWKWYRGTFRTRIWENGAIILIMTRWHEDDLAGRLLAEQADEWTVLRLPAIAESEADRIEQDKFLNIPHLPFDPLNRAEGEPLAPKRFSRKALDELRRDVGETAWAAEYMQVPRSMEGNMMKREWFSQFVNEVPKQCKRVRFWDKASSETDGSCFTAGVLVAMGGDGICYIEDVVKGRWRPEEREKVILQTAELDRLLYNNTVKIWIEQEPGSSGVESSQISIKNLRGYPVYSEKPKGDKNVRLEPFSVQAANGNVRLKRGDWNGAWIEEMCTVPNGKYRDQSDATSGGFNKLALRKNKSVGGRAVGLYGR